MLDKSSAFCKTLMSLLAHLTKSLFFALICLIVQLSDLGLGGCIEHVWRDTIVYLDDKDPVLIGRAYGRVSRHLLHEELLRR